MSASNRQVIYSVLIFVFPKLLLSSGYFQTPKYYRFFSKINSDQTVRIHKNNSDRRRLKFYNSSRTVPLFTRHTARKSAALPAVNLSNNVCQEPLFNQTWPLHQRKYITNFIFTLRFDIPHGGRTLSLELQFPYFEFILIYIYIYIYINLQKGNAMLQSFFSCYVIGFSSAQ